MDHPIMLTHERGIPHVNVKQEVSLFDRGESPNCKVKDSTHPSHRQWDGEANNGETPLLSLLGSCPMCPNIGVR